MKWTGKTSRNNMNLLNMIITVLDSIAYSDRVLSTHTRLKCFFFGMPQKHNHFLQPLLVFQYFCLPTHPLTICFPRCVCVCVYLYSQHQRKSLSLFLAFFFTYLMEIHCKCVICVRALNVRKLDYIQMFLDQKFLFYVLVVVVFVTFFVVVWCDEALFIAQKCRDTQWIR